MACCSAAPASSIRRRSPCPLLCQVRALRQAIHSFTTRRLRCNPSWLFDPGGYRLDPRHPKAAADSEDLDTSHPVSRRYRLSVLLTLSHLPLDPLKAACVSTPQTKRIHTQAADRIGLALSGWYPGSFTYRKAVDFSFGSFGNRLVPLLRPRPLQLIARPSASRS